METKNKEVVEAYRTANHKHRGMLRELFPNYIEMFDKIEAAITERVKTLSDAIEELGEGHPYVETYHAFHHDVRASVGYEYLKDIDAYLQLRIIAAALNEGWVPTYENCEARYYPWFEYCSVNAIERMDEDDRVYLEKYSIKLENNERVKLNVVYDITRFSKSGCIALSSLSGGIPGIYYRTYDLAKYAGEQFADLYVGRALSIQSNDK